MITGRCYCGELEYEFDKSSIQSQMLCLCRECRYLSGGGPNTSIVIKEETLNLRKANQKSLNEATSKTQEFVTFAMIVGRIFA